MAGRGELDSWRKELKRLLRERGVSYRDLSGFLKMSESGIKKLLNAEDLSLLRLSQICRALGISVSDFFASASSEEMKDVRFTDEQQAFFLRNPECFHFFWKLAFERLSVEEVERRHAIKPHESHRYLRALERIGLVRLDARGRAQVPRLKPVRHFGSGPLIEKLYREWTRAFFEKVATPVPRPDSAFAFRYLKMRKETFRDFLDALQELESAFVKRAIREMAIFPDEVGHVRWISGADTGDFVPDCRFVPLK